MGGKAGVASQKAGGVNQSQEGLGWRWPGNGQGWSKSGDTISSAKAWCLEKAHGFNREGCYGTNHTPEGGVSSNIAGKGLLDGSDCRDWSDPKTYAKEPSTDRLIASEFSNDTPSISERKVELPWEWRGIHGGVREKKEEKVPHSVEQTSSRKEAAGSVCKRKLWGPTCEVRQPHRQSGSRWRNRKKRREKQREAAWKRKRKVEGEIEGQAEGKRKRQDEGERSEAEGIPCSWRGGRERKERLKILGAAWGGCSDLQGWREAFRQMGPVEGLHILAFTRRLVGGLIIAPTGVGALLRSLMHSPIGRCGIVKPSKGDPYPLPLEPQVVAAMRVLVDLNVHLVETASLAEGGGLVPPMRVRIKQWAKYNVQQKQQLAAAVWLGLLVVGLNTSLGFTTIVARTQCPLKKAVLSALWTDSWDFLKGDGLSKEVLRWPDVSWGSRIGSLSVSYVGEVVEKARWLTWAQVEPGLPPVGKGGCLDASEFCGKEVRGHLLNPELSRLPDDQVPDELPHAVVRATQNEWNTIAAEMVQRGVACVIEENDIATFRGQKVLNGAFGVVKPNRWVGDGSNRLPVLRLIMDFRAANCLHRMLPGAVDSLVGAAKWMGFSLGPGEVLVSSGDDLVACFYLFKVPFSWSRYFAFRKPVPRRVLGLSGDENQPVYIASQVLPMGWAAAVTVVQHIHRNIALGGAALPATRELHRQRCLPERETVKLSSFWNLYIDDLTVMEVIDEAGLEEARAQGTKSSIQVAMEAAYERLCVPYSKDKASTREEIFEKLGAFVDGRKGMIGVTSKRQLELLSLILFMMQQEKVPTKWLQILLGKFVHMVQFRRPLFSCIAKSWRRLQAFHAGASLGVGELDWSVIAFLLPLMRTELRAGISGVVTCSDASEYGGGICRTLGLTSLGRLARCPPSSAASLEAPRILVIEWFAGIGGLSRSLERLGVHPYLVAVCECDPHCIAVLRKFLPGCTVWKDIKTVTRSHIREILDRNPSIEAVVQGGGSPCQGLSRLSSGRRHFEDDRSVLFYDLKRVMAEVKQEAEARLMKHFGFIEPCQYPIIVS